MLLTVVTFFIVLGVLVLIHELGHFIAAKKMGIKVEEFGVGFPPRVWGKQIGETLYSINLLPIGGFVRLFGEEEGDLKSKEEIREKIDIKRAFVSKTSLQKSAVLLSGVLMNFLLGWLIISFMFTQGVMVPTERVHIDEIEKGSPADLAGLEKGDIIQKFKYQTRLPDGQVSNIKNKEIEEYDIKTPKQLIETTDKYRGEEVILVIERKGMVFEKKLIPREKTKENEGAIGVVVSNYEERIYPPLKAPFLGLLEAVNMSRQLVAGIFGMIVKLITFQGVSREIAGPVGIAQLTGEAVKYGKMAVLELMGLLSLNLAVINLLPVPALDGGRLLFVIIEGTTRRKIRPSFERHIHQIGLAILLSLLLLATINDVMRIVGK